MAARQGWVRRLGQYLREVRAEARKIAWPNRRELTAYTAVVLVVVVSAALFIMLADLVISQLIRVTGIL
ncbi:MAG: preprotein translocase subunit SecE [Firmicutes bacterium]|nr:preprotein translocase subunit SecE [Bacillota bacterium]MBO2520107.1 preprotein translocase subunit SecE [Bacillota bacterium]NMA71305.1 preprotein translocase subunit SecE [Bacillota bacterium]